MKASDMKLYPYRAPTSKTFPMRFIKIEVQKLYREKEKKSFQGATIL